jgi:DNA polymerase III gamma/tau subunit
MLIVLEFEGEIYLLIFKLGPQSKNISADEISRLVGMIVQLVMSVLHEINDEQSRHEISRCCQELLQHGKEWEEVKLKM